MSTRVTQPEPAWVTQALYRVLIRAERGTATEVDLNSVLVKAVALGVDMSPWLDKIEHIHKLIVVGSVMKE